MIASSPAGVETAAKSANTRCSGCDVSPRHKRRTPRQCLTVRILSFTVDESARRLGHARCSQFQQCLVLCLSHPESDSCRTARLASTMSGTLKPKNLTFVERRSLVCTITEADAGSRYVWCCLLLDAASYIPSFPQSVQVLSCHQEFHHVTAYFSSILQTCHGCSKAEWKTVGRFCSIWALL